MTRFQLNDHGSHRVLSSGSCLGEAFTDLLLRCAAREPRRSVDTLSQWERQEAEEAPDWLQAGVG